MKNLLFCLIAMNTACAAIPPVHAEFTALDTFGSPRINEKILLTRYGSRINDFSAVPQDDFDEFFRKKQEIEAIIKKDFGFEYVTISVITYFPPLAGRYATVDVVEQKDTEKRMSFLASPSGKYKDPDGLIALWDEYQNLAFSLQKTGKFSYPKNCPAWHCTHGFEHPQLAPYFLKFESLAKKNETALARIIRFDSRANYRANAAFLLSHIQNGKTLVAYVSPAIFDSSELVRNNVIRILSNIANEHPAIPIDVEAIIKALHFPTATDRNKAGYVLSALSQREELKPTILKGAGWTLLDMLKLQQPNNHDPAYTVLKNISDQKYGERDYTSWESWLKSKIGSR